MFHFDVKFKAQDPEHLLPYHGCFREKGEIIIKLPCYINFSQICECNISFGNFDDLHHQPQLGELGHHERIAEIEELDEKKKVEHVDQSKVDQAMESESIENNSLILKKNEKEKLHKEEALNQTEKDNQQETQVHFAKLDNIENGDQGKKLKQGEKAGALKQVEKDGASLKQDQFNQGLKVEKAESDERDKKKKHDPAEKVKNAKEFEIKPDPVKKLNIFEKVATFEEGKLIEEVEINGLIGPKDDVENLNEKCDQVGEQSEKLDKDDKFIISILESCCQSEKLDVGENAHKVGGRRPVEKQSDNLVKTDTAHFAEIVEKREKFHQLEEPLQYEILAQYDKVVRQPTVKVSPQYKEYHDWVRSELRNGGFPKVFLVLNLRKKI